MLLVSLSYAVTALFVLFNAWFVIGPGFGRSMRGSAGGNFYLVVDIVALALLIGSMVLAFMVYGTTPVPAIVWVVSMLALVVRLIFRPKVREFQQDKKVFAEYLKLGEIPLFGRLLDAEHDIVKAARGYVRKRIIRQDVEGNDYDRQGDLIR